MDKSLGEILLYQTAQGPELEIQFQEETLWLTQAQIAVLFGILRPAITKHLNNIFKSGELSQESVSSILEHTARDGKLYKTQFYNLDAVISVGYRVNSKDATQFRIWATHILKTHLTQGYTLNEKRLREAHHKLFSLQDAIILFQKKSSSLLISDQSHEILNLLANYAKTLTLLERYDGKTLSLPKGGKSEFLLEYKRCLSIVSEVKNALVAKQEAGPLFGQERDSTFEAIISTLYQTFDQQELYPSTASKAAHLLYFVIKDHPFSDGNKRMGSFLFVYFLDQSHSLYKESGERKINDNALTALALFIAESDPKEKETMIALILNLISDSI
ncbi:MAG: Fic/DOC family protein [Candidatus Margulisbacteria bacterium]|nr:Fic/DOC family protein [Candidatus Margulisiibacteriota bacterium]